MVLWLQVNYGPPIWVHILLFAPLTIILSLLTLRWFKGILIAMGNYVCQRQMTLSDILLEMDDTGGAIEEIGE